MMANWEKLNSKFNNIIDNMSNDVWNKWLDTNPRKELIASQCANIAEEYHSEQSILSAVGVTFKEKNIPTFEDWIKTFKEVDGKLYQLDNYRTFCIAAMHEQYRLTFKVEP
jgi:hypothetical protein